MPAAASPLRTLLLASALACAACSTTPPPPPIVSLDGRSCEGAPSLAGAPAVLLDEKEVTASLDAASPCLQRDDGARSAYAVFRLPQSADPYLLGITSLALGSTLFAPRLVVLDADGRKLRELERSAFNFQGAALYAGIRARPEERYLVVASDPASVGQQVSRIAGMTRQTMAGTGAMFFTIHTGSEQTHNLTYSHNGSVSVAARPWPKAN